MLRKTIPTLLTMILTLFFLTLCRIGPLGAIQGDPGSETAKEETLSGVKAAMADGQAGPGRSGMKRYMVRFVDLPLALYQGAIPGLEATSPQATRKSKLDMKSGATAAYRSYLGGKRSEIISAMEGAVGRRIEVIFSYDVVFNGLAVYLALGEVSRVEKVPGVASVSLEKVEQLHTDAGPRWIGAPRVWRGEDGVATRGEGIVVGVIDGGINPENPSFADVGDDGFDHTNPRGRFLGVCDPERPDYDPAFPCNDKLIGAYDFSPLGGNPDNIPTPLDVSGHGSHVAGTAAGNLVRKVAAFEGPTIRVERDISGVAPHANIISYRVCTATSLGVAQDCPGAPVFAALDQAASDGVDVINFSIGSAPYDPWGWDGYYFNYLATRAAGILVVTSAGNSGPRPGTVGSPANVPWIMSVGAATHNRAFVNDLTRLEKEGGEPLGPFRGGGLAAGYGPAPIVYAGSYPNPNDPEGDPALCAEPYPASTFHGEIVVCDLGRTEHVATGRNILQGGAGGLVLANDAAHGNDLWDDGHVLPAVMISHKDGQALKNWLGSGSDHTAVITGMKADISSENGDVMARFSSRGPNLWAPGVIKPDAAAPGVDILAAGGFGGEVTWMLSSGTSMASPHVTGAAALLKALHPDWTPDEIQSALMLTGVRHRMLKENGSTPAAPFDRGAGRIQVGRAARAGFVLNETPENYLAADPSKGGDPSALNLASLANGSVTDDRCSWTRVLRSTLDTDVTWSVRIDNPPGVKLGAEPSTFTLPAGGALAIRFTADTRKAAYDSWLFGNLVFIPSSTDTAKAHFPVALNVLNTLPERLKWMEVDNPGEREINVAYGRTIEDLSSRIYGLAPGRLKKADLYQDPTPVKPFDVWPPKEPKKGVFMAARSIGDGVKRLVAEIAGTTSPDVDLYIYDATREETVCRSANYGNIEYCNVNDPKPGEYWIIAQNYHATDPSGTEPDTVEMAVAVVGPHAEGNLHVGASGGQTGIPGGQPFKLKVQWDVDPAFRHWYGFFTLGSKASRPDDIGGVRLDLRLR